MKCDASIPYPGSGWIVTVASQWVEVASTAVILVLHIEMLAKGSYATYRLLKTMVYIILL